MKFSILAVSALSAAVLAAPVPTEVEAAIEAREPAAKPQNHGWYGRKEGEALGFTITKREAEAEAAAEPQNHGWYGRKEGEVLGFTITKREPVAEAEAEAEVKSKRGECGPNPHAQC